MEKKLILVRHAKSSWSNSSLSDIERPLNDRGHRDAPMMALKLDDMGIIIQQYISSPAVRAKQTCELFVKTTNKNPNIEFYKNLYHGDVSDIIEVVNLISDEIQCAAIFAHNPGITYFANDVAGNYIDNVPTCGILIMNVLEESWNNVSIKSLSIDQFIYPKMYL